MILRKLSIMSDCCAECGERTRNIFVSADGFDVCKTCYNAGLALTYLRHMEERRAKDEACNKLAYEQCRELSAWISVYRFGIDKYRQRAAAVINSWTGHS